MSTEHDRMNAFIDSQPTKTVETRYGPITGYVIEGVAHFKGIPYAAPPVGGLRWKPPAPPSPWKEPFKAIKFSSICPQDTTLFPAFEQMGEDCLSLNIWAPEKTETGLYPVMVWLHGGGFSSGTGSMPLYDGTYFASIGIVVVTINYRLNVLGFLAHPGLTAESPDHSSGNYGLLDQIFALQWVQDNISLFGGDPGKVTIFGESAGGASVVALMSSPLTGGLFHRAIAQSCGNAPMNLRRLTEKNGSLYSAESLGVRFARALGLDGGKGEIDKMRSLAAENLVKVWYKTIQEDPASSGFTGSWQTNHLIIDGYVLGGSPGVTFRRGKQHKVPFMTGTTVDEGTMFQLFLFAGPPDLGRYQRFIGKAFPGTSGKVLEYFRAANDEAAGRAACSIFDSGFFCGARRLARNMSAVEHHTYRYLFAMPPKFFLYQIPGVLDWKERFGCFHGAEIPYVFHFMALPGLEDEDRALADRMARYWVRFATTGDPNGNDDPCWPVYSRQDEQYLVLTNPVETGYGYRDAECDFAEEIEEAEL
ncbi:MAG: carboxylesterase family protein [Dehalococcoidia bacterium]|nr:carboxylesterase family protein [Dehalococcoidia bacterium]